MRYLFKFNIWNVPDKFMAQITSQSCKTNAVGRKSWQCRRLAASGDGDLLSWRGRTMRLKMNWNHRALALFV